MKKLFPFFLILLVICAVISLYSSSAVVLYLADVKINFTSLKYSIFIDTIKNFYGVKGYTKYIIGGSVGAVIPFVLWIALLILVFVGTRKKNTIHGEARFSNDKDLEKSGFFPTQVGKYPAILIGKMFKGKFKDQFIQYCGQQFLMLYAPTRSGKGVGIVIPNCINYSDSIVVLDIKLENFIFSAGYREQFLKQKVFLFAPDGYANKEDMANRKVRSSRYNPLFYIRRDPLYRFSDLSKISAILFPKSGGENDMWTDLSANLFNALVLFLLDLEDEYEITYEDKMDEKGMKCWIKDGNGEPILFDSDEDKLDENGNKIPVLDENGNVIYQKNNKGEVEKYMKNGKLVPLPIWQKKKIKRCEQVEISRERRYKVTLSQVLKLSVPTDGSPLGDWLLNEIKKRNSDSNKKAWDEHYKKGAKRPDFNMLSDEALSLIYQFTNQQERQRQNIMLTFNAELKIFGNPITAAATDDNDFDLRNVRREKMSIYFGLSPDALPVYAKLTNLFFSQIVNENVGSGKLPEQDPTLKYQCLLILDEFTSMGRVEIIQKAIAFTAGYNIRFLFILQNKGQLEDEKTGYGKDGAKTFIENCAVELVYPPRFVNEQVESVSESIGYYDMKVKNVSHSKGKESSRTISYNTEKRAVMLPQEIVELRDIKHKSGVSTREIIMSEFCRPFIADKIIYFDEPFFIERKNYAEKNVPNIPILDVNEDLVAKAFFEQQ